jgi:hypothetical protein
MLIAKLPRAYFAAKSLMLGVLSMQLSMPRSLLFLMHLARQEHAHDGRQGMEHPRSPHPASHDIRQSMPMTGVPP